MINAFKIALVLLSISYLGIFPSFAQSLTSDDSGKEWIDLFEKDLSNATYPKGIWSLEDGVLTATEDQAIWTNATYDNFELQLEFKNAEGTNSGVFVYADTTRALTHSVEIQIADDYSAKWANSPKNWQCAAIFGHQAAIRTKIVKAPGKWNRYRIVAKGSNIEVYLNGQLANELNMADFTSATINNGGSEVPEWLSVPMADIRTSGHIGLQGKHAVKPIWFRNLRIRKIE